MAKKQRVIPRLKPVPYTLADLSTSLRQPQLVPATVINNGRSQIQLYSTPDLPNNKRGFKYVPCRPNPYLDSVLYSTTDLPPYGVRWSYFDRSPEMFVDQNMTFVGTQESDGWRSTRASVGIREGSWYIEYRIISGIGEMENGDNFERQTSELSRSVTPMHSNISIASHVRLGIARREASLEAPVGFDGYGYGIRDISCEKVHLSRRSEIKEGNNVYCNDDLKIGDVVGLLVELPDMKTQTKIASSMIDRKTLADPHLETDPGDGIGHSSTNQHSFIEKGIEREMIPIKYKSELFFEEYEYTSSKSMEHLLNPVTVFGERAIPDKEKFQPAKLPNSSITLFVNGKRKGVPFENLFAFLPPASEQRMARSASKPSSKKNREEESFIVDRDDGELGYYPMVSSFRGGVVEINASGEVWQKPEELKEKLAKGAVRPYGDRVKYKVVEEYVYDLVDNAVNKYLDRKEYALQ